MKQVKLGKLLLIGIFILAMFGQLPYQTVESITPTNSDMILNDDASRLSDIKVLAIIGNQFGDAYFWVKDQFESWGCNYTTVGLCALCSSCPHKPQRPVTPELLIGDVTDEILLQFDAVYVPPGAHWISLLVNTQVKNLLSNAYNLGLIVSGICIGTKIIAAANDLVAGAKVAFYSESSTEMQAAGATVLFGSSVVSDKRIVTATTGTCGSTNPYIYQFCVAIAKEVKGYSAVLSSSIEPQENSKNNYTLVVTTTDLTNIFYGNTSTEIASVKAILTWSKGSTETSLTLTEGSSSDTFTGNFTKLEKGKYSIELEVRSYGYGVEVVRDEVSFKVSLSGLFLGAIIVGWLGLIYYRKDS